MASVPAIELSFKYDELNTLAALKLVALCHLGPQTLKLEI